MSRWMRITASALLLTLVSLSVVVVLPSHGQAMVAAAADGGRSVLPAFKFNFTKFIGIVVILICLFDPDCLSG